MSQVIHRGDPCRCEYCDPDPEEDWAGPRKEQKKVNGTDVLERFVTGQPVAPEEMEALRTEVAHAVTLIGKVFAQVEIGLASTDGVLKAEAEQVHSDPYTQGYAWGRISSHYALCQAFGHLHGMIVREMVGPA